MDTVLDYMSGEMSAGVSYESMMYLVLTAITIAIIIINKE